MLVVSVMRIVGELAPLRVTSPLEVSPSTVAVPVTSMPMEVVASLAEPLLYRVTAPSSAKRAIFSLFGELLMIS